MLQKFVQYFAESIDKIIIDHIAIRQTSPTALTLEEMLFV